MSKKNNSQRDKKELRIRDVSELTHAQLCNIASWKDCRLSFLMKEILQEIIDEHPPHMSETTMQKTKMTEIRITSVLQETHEKIDNIASWTSISISNLIKAKLTKKVYEYPEDIREPLID